MNGKNTKKQNAGARLILLLLAALVLAAGACQSMPSLVSEPQFSFNSLAITGLSFDGADLLAKVNVKNGNPFTIPLPELDWEFFVTGTSFLSGNVKNNDSKIAANTTSVMEIPFKLTYQNLYAVVTDIIDADEAPVKIDVGARFPIPVIKEKTFKTSFEGVLPMLKMPNLSFGGVKVNTINLTRAEFVLNFNLENRNSFDINLDSLAYNFALNGTPLASGSAPRQFNLAARKETQVPVTVTVNSLSVLQQLLSLASSGKGASYSCSGETALTPRGFENFLTLKMPFNYSGNTALK